MTLTRSRNRGTTLSRSRGRGTWRLAIGLFQSGTQFGLERGQCWFIRDVRATKGLPGDLGGNLERARNLADRRALDFAVAEVFEETQDGGEEFLTGDPFLFPKF